MAPLVTTSTVSCLILAISLAAAMMSPAHAAQNPPAIFVFGDSLSDVGNNNVLAEENARSNFPHYGVDFPGGEATGRFTNGYNFVDVIAQHVGFDQSPPPFVSVSESDITKGVNFASGGSGLLVDCMDGTKKMCFTMKEQMDNFKSVRTLLVQELGIEGTKKLLSRSLFLFTCGTNDLDYYNDHPSGPIDEYVANMTSAFSSQLRELYELGGRKFAIVNVPAIGKIPAVRALDCLDFNILGFVLNIYAQKFNDAEAAMLQELYSTLPGMKYSIGNAYAVITDVTSNPEKYGLIDVVHPCCGEVHLVFAIPPVNITRCSPTSILCSNRSKYAFWDAIHPTQAVIDPAVDLFYSGGTSYVSPINLKQLVEEDESAPRPGVSLRGVGSFEAM